MKALQCKERFCDAQQKVKEENDILKNFGGLVAVLLVWVGAAVIGIQFFGPDYMLWPTAILGGIGTIWILKSAQS
jgi:hypothetical protein